MEHFSLNSSCSNWPCPNNCKHVLNDNRKSLIAVAKNLYTAVLNSDASRCSEPWFHAWELNVKQQISNSKLQIDNFSTLNLIYLSNYAKIWNILDVKSLSIKRHLQLNTNVQ